jgi:hypothetical protein
MNLYEKYPHIIPKSIEEVLEGTTIVCGGKDKLISKGKICVIRCKNADTESKCLKTRVINIQDVNQVYMCKICVRLERNARRRIRRKEC